MPTKQQIEQDFAGMQSVDHHRFSFNRSQGSPRLSKTYQSSNLLPSTSNNRITLSQNNYDGYRSSVPLRQQSLNGVSPGTTTASGLRPATNSARFVNRGHYHVGSGVEPNPTAYEDQRQYYDITSTQRSNVRQTDELLPSPTKSNVSLHRLKTDDPQSDLYASHRSKFEVFPAVESQRGQSSSDSNNNLRSNSENYQNDVNQGDQDGGLFINHTPVHYEMMNGASAEPQAVYPLPPPSMMSNRWSASSHRGRSASSTLDEVQLSQWQTTYQKSFGSSSRVSNGWPYYGTTSAPPNYHMETDSKRPNAYPHQNHTARRVAKSAPVTTADRNSSREISHGWRTSATPVRDDALNTTAFNSRKAMSARSVTFDDQVKYFHGNDITKSQSVPSAANRSRGSLNGESISNGMTTAPQPISKASTPGQWTYIGGRSFEADRRGMGAGLQQQQQQQQQRGHRSLQQMQDQWSRTDAIRRFNQQHPEASPDLRRNSDQRFSGVERRHVVPEAGHQQGYHFH